MSLPSTAVHSASLATYDETWAVRTTATTTSHLDADLARIPIPIATATHGGPMGGVTTGAMTISGIMGTAIPAQVLGVTTNTHG